MLNFHDNPPLKFPSVIRMKSEVFRNSHFNLYYVLSCLDVMLLQHAAAEPGEHVTH